VKNVGFALVISAADEKELKNFLNTFLLAKVEITILGKGRVHGEKYNYKSSSIANNFLVKHKELLESFYVIYTRQRNPRGTYSHCPIQRSIRSITFLLYHTRHNDVMLYTVQGQLSSQHKKVIQSSF
jgi:hypothetical protein